MKFYFWPSLEKILPTPTLLKSTFSTFFHSEFDYTVVLVVSIGHIISCSILFGITLSSLFCLTVLLCSVYHLKFKK